MFLFLNADQFWAQEIQQVRVNMAERCVLYVFFPMFRTELYFSVMDTMPVVD